MVVPSRKNGIVCLDPGHPSEVGEGTRGKRTTEVTVVWQMALRVRALLEREGVAVVLTKRRVDQFVTNKQRARIANAVKADLMLRLHCDAASGSGTATYYPNREGIRDGMRGPSAEVIARSGRAARRFHPTMMRVLDGTLPDQGIKPDAATLIGSRQGALTGSIFSQVPVLLIEMCVLTNPDDEAFIASEGGQRRMAAALLAGIQAALRIDKAER